MESTNLLENNHVFCILLNENVAFGRLSTAEMSELLESSENRLERQKNAQKVLNYLCATYSIPQCKLVVTDNIQPHKTTTRGTLKSKILGHYKPSGKEITIFNRTAVRKQSVSIKCFIDTLLHEFMHHYDIEYLKLGGTLHTAGFYKRISDLRNKLTE